MQHQPLDPPSQANREGVPIHDPERGPRCFNCTELLTTTLERESVYHDGSQSCNNVVCLRVLLSEISEHAQQQDNTVRFAREEVLKLAGWAREW